VNKRYPVLEIISILLKILSVITFLAGIFLIIVVLFGDDYFGLSKFLNHMVPFFGSFLLTIGIIPIVLYSLLAALVFWGFAELINCIVAIEYNTRVGLSKDKEPVQIKDPNPILTKQFEPPIINDKNTISNEQFEDTIVDKTELSDHAQPIFKNESKTVSKKSKNTSNENKVKTKREFNIKTILKKKLW
jgi:hypothetical protein